MSKPELKQRLESERESYFRAAQTATARGAVQRAYRFTLNLIERGEVETWAEAFRSFDGFIGGFCIGTAV